jgi:addiction module RelB/DinJ family antitoxin
MGASKMPTIQFRTDDQTKAASTALFDKLGITMSEAINMFLRQAVMREGVPFLQNISKPLPNLNTISGFGLDTAITDAVRRYKYLNNNAEPDMSAGAPFFMALRALGDDVNPRITLYTDAVKAQITYKECVFTIDYHFEEAQSVYILVRKGDKILVKDCDLADIAQTLGRF